MNCKFRGLAALAWATLVLTFAACGGGGSTYGNSSIPPSLSLFAGSLDYQGSADGPGQAATFNGPSGLATDSAGNVYVADFGNSTIRKITPAGVVSTLAGTAGVIGHADGNAATASFYQPYGLATDSMGNVYVSDHGNSTVRKITTLGIVSTLAGSAAVRGGADGAGAAASFIFPFGLATDRTGNVYVADCNHTIRKITPAGVVSTFAGSAGVWGNADGVGADANFYFPTGVATDSADNVYVANSGTHTIRKITPDGVVSTLAGTAGVIGHADGLGASASFNNPSGLATDSAGNVYVADFGNRTIRKITPAGVVSTLAGTAGVDGFSPGALPGVLFAENLTISASSLFFTNGRGVAVIRNLP